MKRVKTIDLLFSDTGAVTIEKFQVYSLVETICCLMSAIFTSP